MRLGVCDGREQRGCVGRGVALRCIFKSLVHPSSTPSTISVRGAFLTTSRYKKKPARQTRRRPQSVRRAVGTQHLKRGRRHSPTGPDPGTFEQLLLLIINPRRRCWLNNLHLLLSLLLHLVVCCLLFVCRCCCLPDNTTVHGTHAPHAHSFFIDNNNKTSHLHYTPSTHPLFNLSDSCLSHLTQHTSFQQPFVAT